MLIFEVSAAWMKACGKGAQARAFPVLEVQETRAADDFFSKMFVLDIGDGRQWVVAQGRGRLLDDCDTLAEAMQACVANMIERMREDYHNHNAHYADEAINFITTQLGESDAAEIIGRA